MSPPRPGAGFEAVRRWFRHHLANPQVVLLALLLGLGLAAVMLLGRMLAPLIGALVIAYVLDAPAETLRRHGMPNTLAVTLVFVGFLSLILFSLLAVLPLLSSQLTQLVVLLPSIVSSVQELLLALPDRYPDLIDRAQVVELTGRLRQELLVMGQNAVLLSVDRIGNLLTLGVYLFLVPLMVFFFLKDKQRIRAWFIGFLPEERALVTDVWTEVDHKIGAYLRGKVYEIGIVGGAAWLIFTLLGLEFTLLLAALTGLSVLIPYIGVVAVSVPVILVGFFQFGLTGPFLGVVGAYAVLQVIDGNLLAPLLISEVVDLHPIAVIAAILVFGGIWGFWGVFFAIPLATLATAVLNAWPDTAERAAEP